MAFFTALAIIGVGAAIAGTVVQMQGARKAAKAQKAALRAQQDAEDQRRRQMELEAQRQRRKAIREAIVARAQAVSAATNQGAQSGTGLAGGLAQVTGQQNTNIQAINQNEEIGGNIFDAGARETQANIQLANARGREAFGSGLSSLGGAIVNNLGSLNRLGVFGSSKVA